MCAACSGRRRQGWVHVHRAPRSVGRGPGKRHRRQHAQRSPGASWGPGFLGGGAGSRTSARGEALAVLSCWGVWPSCWLLSPGQAVVSVVPAFVPTPGVAVGMSSCEGSGPFPPVSMGSRSAVGGVPRPGPGQPPSLPDDLSSPWLCSCLRAGLGDAAQVRRSPGPCDVACGWRAGLRRGTGRLVAVLLATWGLSASVGTRVHLLTRAVTVVRCWVSRYLLGSRFLVFCRQGLAHAGSGPHTGRCWERVCGVCRPRRDGAASAQLQLCAHSGCPEPTGLVFPRLSAGGAPRARVHTLPVTAARGVSAAQPGDTSRCLVSARLGSGKGCRRPQRVPWGSLTGPSLWLPPSPQRPRGASLKRRLRHALVGPDLAGGL